MSDTTETHWTKDKLTTRVYWFAWVVLVALLLGTRWLSPAAFEMLIAAMLASAVLRIVILEVEAGI